MTYQATLNQLNQTYSVVGAINLSEHNSNSLLSALSLYKNKIFKDNERLVIIADQSLPAKFEGRPPDIMPKMQEYIRDLNIAHFFILMVTNIDKAEQYLLQLKQMYYSTEDTQITVIHVQN